MTHTPPALLGPCHGRCLYETWATMFYARPSAVRVALPSLTMDIRSAPQLISSMEYADIATAATSRPADRAALMAAFTRAVSGGERWGPGGEGEGGEGARSSSWSKEYVHGCAGGWSISDRWVRLGKQGSTVTARFMPFSAVALLRQPAGWVDHLHCTLVPPPPASSPVSVMHTRCYGGRAGGAADGDGDGVAQQQRHEVPGPVPGAAGVFDREGEAPPLTKWSA